VMRSFCSALNMSDYHCLRSAASAPTLQDRAHRLPAIPTSRCDAAVRREPAPPPGV